MYIGYLLSSIDVHSIVYFVKIPFSFDNVYSTLYLCIYLQKYKIYTSLDVGMSWGNIYNTAVHGTVLHFKSDDCMNLMNGKYMSWYRTWIKRTSFVSTYRQFKLYPFRVCAFQVVPPTNGNGSYIFFTGSTIFVFLCNFYRCGKIEWKGYLMSLNSVLCA